MIGSSPARVVAGILLVVGVIVGVVPALWPGTARAQTVTAQDTRVTWSVRPASAAGADGRSWVELELEPGEPAQEFLEVRNLSRHEVVFAIHAADGYFTDRGRFNMLPAGHRSTGAGGWIEVQDTVTVAGGASAIVPFAVTVPPDATPGDHPAGIAVTVRSAATDQGGGTVGVESRIGFRVMTRVTGELRPAVALEVDGSYAVSWNPFDPGAVDVRYAVTNSGNTRLAVAPALQLSGLLGIGARELAAAPIVEIAPGETRSGTERLSGVWPVGPLTLQLRAEATVVGAGTHDDAVVTAGRSSSIWAMPWPQLLCLAVVTALLLWHLHERRRRQRELHRLVEAAREAANAAAALGRHEVDRRQQR